MLTETECILMADNYAAAARLSCSPERQVELMALSALWRANALKTRARNCGLHITERDLDARYGRDD